jgi:hypothetical protein
LLVYWPSKWKVNLWDHHTVCLSANGPSPANNFWTNWYIFMKFKMEVIPFESDLSVILLNVVVSTITKWRTFLLLRWEQNLSQSIWDHVELRLVTMATTVYSCDS